MNGVENKSEKLKELLERLQLAVKEGKGNRFEIAEQIFDVCGYVNIEALLGKECTHEKELPNGAKIRILCHVSPQYWVDFDEKDGFSKAFRIEAKICPICGKTVEIEAKRAISRIKEEK